MRLSTAQIAEKAAARYNKCQSHNWRAIKPPWSEDEKLVLVYLTERVMAGDFGTKRAGSLIHTYFPWRSRGAARQKILRRIAWIKRHK